MSNTKTTKTSSWLPWTIWALCALFYTYENLLQVSQGVMVNELMHDLNLTATLLSQLGAVYLWAYALLQIPVGVLLDTYSTRKLLALATLTCAGGCWIYAIAHGLAFAALGRFLIGLGSGFAALGGMQLAASWFPATRFAFLTGALLTFGMLGQISGEAPLSYLVDAHGWRLTLQLLTYVGSALAALVWLVVRDHPDAEQIKTDNQETFSELWPKLRNLVSKPQVWIVALFAMLMFTPILVLSNLWGIQFVMQSQKLSLDLAANTMSTALIGFAVGAPILGWFSDRIKRRKPPLVISAVGALVTMLIILYAPALPLTAFSTVLFLMGFFTSGFLPGFSIMKEINSAQVRVTALGFMNTINMLGGAIFLPVIGKLLDHAWKGAMHEGVRQYSLANFHHALMVLPIFLAIACLMLPAIKETHCKSQS